MQEFYEEDKLGKAYDAQLMKRLLKYIKPYRWFVALSILLLLIASGLELLVPYLTKLGIDAVVNGKADDFTNVLWFMGAVMTSEFFFGTAQIYIMEWIGQSAMFDLRQTLFEHVQKMHLAFFDRNPSGRLLTRITSDVNALNELFASGVVDIFGSLIKVFGIVAIMLYLSWELTLVTFVIVPLITTASFLFRKKVRDSYRNIRLILARLNAFTQEHLAGMSEVQYFVQQRKTMRGFDSLNDNLRYEHHRSIMYYAIFFPVVELIGAISLALIIWYGGGQVVQNAITLGTLAAFIGYLEKFYRPIRDLAEKYNILQAAMASSERIFNILDTKAAITAPAVPMSLNGYRGSISFDKVHFAYNPDEPVLRDISFKIKPGEKVALVGATGAGKTSTVSLLCRFYDIQEGSIRFDDTDIRDVDPVELRKQIGLVLQDVFLFAGSIKDNITLGNEAITDEKVKAASERVGLMPFINRLEKGFDHNVGERGGNLSVGQRQLVSFARALAYDPKLLILDEATSSVDNETEHIIQEALHHLFEGRTSVVVAHRLSTIKEADMILVFHKGRIVERGRHEELLKQGGVYWRLYQLQYQDQETLD